MPEVPGETISKAVIVFATGMGMLHDLEDADEADNISMEFLAFLGKDVLWVPHDEPPRDAYIMSDVIVQKLNLLLGPNGLTIAKIYREKRKTHWGAFKATTLKYLLNLQVDYRALKDWWVWRWS